MRRVKVLFINVVVLSATSLLMRTIGLSFQVYLSNLIGSAGIGLFQLIMSVYYLAITFSISGIRLATTRLVAEELGIGNNLGVKKAVRKCLTYSILFSFFCANILYFNAEFIGTKWLCDARTILSLRILSISLPFMAISSVFNGYFTAVRRALKAASVQFIEQILTISVTLAFLAFFMSGGIEYMCAALVIGSGIGEVLSLLLLLLLYHFDSRRYNNSRKSSNDLLPRMLKIALPVAFSAYITSIMRTLQHLLIPFGLKKSGISSETALATYGTIHGMVMPVLMFPSVFLDTISDLIVPELAECQACGSKKRMNYIVTRVLNIGIMCSICVMSIFLRFSNELGIAIYKSNDAAYYIRILAPIIPVMYLDSIVDSMLKGIGQQLSSMRYNIIDSSISVALIYILIPKYAIAAYIFTIFFSRILNFSLSLNRLIKITELKINFTNIAKSFICIISSIFLSGLFFYVSALYINIALVSITYFILLRMMSCITHDDLQWFKTILK